MGPLFYAVMRLGRMVLLCLLDDLARSLFYESKSKGGSGLKLLSRYIGWEHKIGF